MFLLETSSFYLIWPVRARGAVDADSRSLVNRLRGWRHKEPLVAQEAGEVYSRLAPNW